MSFDERRLRVVPLAADMKLATNQIYDAIGLHAPFEASGSIPFLGGQRFGSTTPLLDLVGREFRGAVGFTGEGNPNEIQKSIMGNAIIMLLAEEPETRVKAFNSFSRSTSRFIPLGTQIFSTAEGIAAVRDG